MIHKKKVRVVFLLILLVLILSFLLRMFYDSKIIVDPNLKGFHWPYIYSVDKTLKNNKKVHILIRSNNTGFPSNDYEKIKERTLEKYNRFNRRFEDLNVIYMNPIFPRIKNLHGSEYNFHNLARNTFDLREKKYDRVDNQLIHMIEDLKNRLKKEHNILVEDKVLLYGFSASGDFADRFSLLHPEIVKAVVIGGCSVVTPAKVVNKENLPYPIGIYDLSSKTGVNFNSTAFSHLDRFIFKGSLDHGGTQTVTNGGQKKSYPWIEYATKKYSAKFSNDTRSPVYSGQTLSNTDSLLIKYRISNKSFNPIDEFNEVKKAFAELGYSRNQFIEYAGVGHKVTDEIYADIFNFIKRVTEI
ncbi:MAG: hypothetical protein GY834_12680 [Bacteroidetes bacterium]|nr:hypothetical protein [Bacteroidota bacterium]